MRGLLLALLIALGAAPRVLAQQASAGAGPSPKPRDNPNVVVLGGNEAFWNDPILDNPVSVSLKNADLGAAVARLAKLTGLSMVALGGPKAKQRATLELDGVPIRDAMKAVAASYGLRWRKDGDVYTLLNDPKRPVHFTPMSAFKRPVLPKPGPGITLYRVNGRKARRHPKRRVKVIIQR